MSPGASFPGFAAANASPLNTRVAGFFFYEKIADRATPLRTRQAQDDKPE